MTIIYVGGPSTSDGSIVDINGGTVDGTVIGSSSPAAGTFTNLTVTGTVTGITASNVTPYMPEYYGAIGDGTLHKISDSVASGGLNISTMSALSAISKYSWITSRPFGNNFNMWSQVAASSGATTIDFTQTINLSATAASGQNFLVIAAATHPELRKGVIVSGTGIPTGTVIAEFNDATGQIMLNGNLTSSITSGTAVTFGSIPSNLVTGMAFTGPVINNAGTTFTPVPSNTTVTAINSGTGVVTISNALTAAAPIGTQFGFYSNYTDAQVANMSMAWLGIQSAIQYAVGQGGGTVNLAVGTYITTAPIILPQCFETDIPSGTAVHLIGQGTNVTYLTPNADFGYGQAVVSCDDPAGTVWNGRGRYGSGNPGACYGTLADMTIKSTASGSYGISPYLGSSPIAMTGLSWGSRRFISRISVFNFMWGCDMVGDHTNWDTCNFGNCFGNLFVNVRSQYLQSDLVWHDMSIANANFANVFIDKSGYLSCYSDYIFMGLGIYTFYIEAGVADGLNPNLYNPMAVCFFGEIQAEGWGNALIQDGNGRSVDGAMSGTRRVTINDITINNLFTTGGGITSVTAGGQKRYAYIDVYAMNDFRLLDIVPTSCYFQTGMSSFINAATGGGNRLTSSQLTTMINTWESVGGQFYNVPDVTTKISCAWEQYPNYKGRFYLYVTIPATLPLGTCVEWRDLHSVQASSGNYSIVGVTITNVSASSSNRILAICEEGDFVPVNTGAVALTGAGYPSQNQYLKAGSGGVAALASNPADGFVFAITANTNNVNGSVNNSQCKIPYSSGLGNNPTITGILTTSSGEVKNTRVVTASGTITATTSDRYIVVNKTTGAASAVTLFSSPATGAIITIKDGKGDAGTNNITITPAAGNIDGSATYVMNTNYQSQDLIYNGTQWNKI